MLQVAIKNGVVLTETVPRPIVTKGSVLIKVAYSCISAGTEMSTVQNSGKSLVQRALEQPQNIKKAVDMLKSEGISKTAEKILERASVVQPSGYSVSGRVVGVSPEVSRFKVGDRVAASGAGMANHAEFVDIPENLCVKIPDNCTDQAASTVTLGAIALNGVRRAGVSIGESVVVVGAGVLGLLTMQILKAAGIRVLITDVQQDRLAKALKLGADLAIDPNQEDCVRIAKNFTSGYGADVVIFTAATSSHEPLSQAFKMCRKRGRVVMVGVAGDQIQRSDMYENELEYIMATSTGPGRYDPLYEEHGIDYPLPYVRWTQNRNMSEYLHLIAGKKIDIESMTDGTYEIKNADDAFRSLQQASENRPVLVFLKYHDDTQDKSRSDLSSHDSRLVLKQADSNKKNIRVGMIGLGGYAGQVILPAIKSLSEQYAIESLVTRDGLKAKAIAEKFGANSCGTDPHVLISDPSIDLVIVATRHDSHASFVLEALKKNKNIFVEKPLATTEDELNKIEAYFSTRNESQSACPILFVGFNRRFSPLSIALKQHLNDRKSPLLITYRMFAGLVPASSWLHRDGGRIIGEACHNIDLARYFVGRRAIEVQVATLSGGESAHQGVDNKIITITYEDGSVASIQYFTLGANELAKEHIELHWDGKTAIIENFKSLKFLGVKKSGIELARIDKGQSAQFEKIAEALQTKSWVIPLDELIETSRIAIVAAKPT